MHEATTDFIPLGDWKALGDFMDIGPHRVFVLRCGSGPNLLLFNGYPTASWGWHRMWPTLTKHFTVTAMDLPGSGFADKPRRGPYNIAYLADVTEAVLARLEVNETHVAAHAYGSTIAQELLARHYNARECPTGGPALPGYPTEARLDGHRPATPRLRSITFINGGLFPEATRPTATQKLLLSPIGPLIPYLFPTPYRAFSAKFGATFGPATRPDTQAMRAFWELLRENHGHKRVPLVLRYLKERVEKRPRWVGALQRTQVPLCCVNGAADPVSGEHVPKFWSALLPNQRLVQLNPKIGHYPPFEDPAGVFAALHAFTRHFRQTRFTG